MKSIYETTGNGNEQQGDYMYPNIRVNVENEYHIGVWGQRYRKLLQEHYKIIYFNFLTKGTLYEYLAQKENVTEKLEVDKYDVMGAKDE
ncbi:TnpV protein [Anaerostipes sp.]|uniref:TnpV protein n=1 Tax=Anaerostipes sp. TaxID=1872530 RepID=UPI0025BFF507|nr:TnpV protein [Anaerostipes sp.]